MKIFILFLFLLFSLKLFADQPRYSHSFLSKNNKYILELNNPKSRFDYSKNKKEIWSLKERETGIVKYNVISIISNKLNLISNDGENIISIDDYSEYEVKKSLKVISFFKLGKIIHEYKLGDLLENINNVSHSASHFNWFFRNKTFKVDDKSLFLTTYELRNYVFNISDGTIVKIEKDNKLNGDALYLYGKLKRINESKWEIEVMHLVQGNINGARYVNFTTDKKILEDGWYYTIIIKNGRLYEIVDVSLNVCSYKHKKL